MNLLWLILAFQFCLMLAACSGENRNVTFFKETKAYELAKAVENSDLEVIEKLVKENKTLLNVTDPVSGSNVLVLAVYIEQFESFKKLLELGADPNFINPYDKYSVLIDACKFYFKPEPYTIDLRYVKLLLKYGANPNYTVEEEFTDEKGYHHFPNSPLMNASHLDLNLVKILIEHGADPFKKIKENQSTPFSEAAQSGMVEIVNYYIDSLKVDVHQPMSIVVRKPDNIEVTYYIQDYLINEYCMAKLIGDTLELEKLRKSNDKIDKANEELWELIKKLESMEVDFKNYDYKLK